MARIAPVFADDSPQAKLNRGDRRAVNKIVAKALGERHPWWMKRRAFWQKAIDFYEADPDAMRLYIHRHARESLKSHASRCARVSYRNYIEAVINCYIHFIFSKQILRSALSKAQQDQMRAQQELEGKSPTVDPAAPEGTKDPDEAGDDTEAAVESQKRKADVIPFTKKRIDDEWQDEFLNDVDGIGTPIDRYMADTGRMANLYEKMYVVVDLPRTAARPQNEAQRQTMKLRPYLRSYTPLDAVNFELDDNGELEWIRFLEVPSSQVGPLDSREDKLKNVMSNAYGWDATAGVPTQPRPTPAQQRRGGADVKGPQQYRTFTKQGWMIHLVEGDTVALIGEGQYAKPLGRVPVVSVYGNKGARFSFGGSSLIQGILSLAQEILNLDSLISEAIYQQTLSILVMGRQPVDGDEIVVSESNVLEVSPGSFPPYYLTPSQAPVQFMEQRIQVLAQDIYRLSKFGGGFGIEPKAMAPTTAAYEFNLTNRAIAERAGNLESAELEIHKLWYAYMGAEFRGFVEYPEDFSIQSFQEMLAELAQAKQAFRSPSAKREMEKKAVRRILATHDEDVLRKIDEEIDLVPDSIDSFNGPVWFDPINQEVSQPGSGVPVGPLAEALRARGIDPQELAVPPPGQDPQIGAAQQMEQQQQQQAQQQQAGKGQQQGGRPASSQTAKDAVAGKARRRKRGRGGKGTSQPDAKNAA